MANRWTIVDGIQEALQQVFRVRAKIAEMRDITRTLGGVQVTGIVGNCERTPIDECGHVYKDLDEVLAVLEAEGIARIVRRLYPVANIKGVE